MYGLYTKELKKQIENKLQGLQFQLHALEAHPLTHFYHMLWEGTGHWCMLHRVSRPEVHHAEFRLRRVPDTIVWESNIPKGWYRYDEDRDGSGAVVGNIKREKVDTQKVDAAFTAGKADTDIVATYTSRGLYKGREVTKVLHLTTLTLRGFLFSRNRGKGSCIIQQWVEPQNAKHNDVIQAVWTHGLKCIVERRRNKQRLDDVSIPLAARIATFDGPQHLSEHVAVASKLASDVRMVCDSIVEHFAANATSRGRRYAITRMIVHLKVDKRQRLTLLGLVGVRVAQRPCPRKELHLALDLAPEYVHVADEEQQALFMGLDDGEAPKPTPAPEALTTSPLTPTEVGPIAVARRQRRGKNILANRIKKTITAAKAMDKVGLLAAPAVPMEEEPRGRRHWFTLQTAVVSRMYLGRDSAAKLLSEIEDVCYRAVSQKLSRTRKPFTFSISPFHRKFIHAATAFVTALQVAELETMMPDFWRDHTVFTIPDAVVKHTPHHHYDVCGGAARDGILAVVAALQELCSRPDDVFARPRYRKVPGGEVVFLRIPGVHVLSPQSASTPMCTPQQLLSNATSHTATPHAACQPRPLDLDAPRHEEAPKSPSVAEGDALRLDDVLIASDDAASSCGSARRAPASKGASAGNVVVPPSAGPRRVIGSRHSSPRRSVQHDAVTDGMLMQGALAGAARRGGSVGRSGVRRRTYTGSGVAPKRNKSYVQWTADGGAEAGAQGRVRSQRSQSAVGAKVRKVSFVERRKDRERKASEVAPPPPPPPPQPEEEKGLLRASPRPSAEPQWSSDESDGDVYKGAASPSPFIKPDVPEMASPPAPVGLPPELLCEDDGGAPSPPDSPAPPAHELSDGHGEDGAPSSDDDAADVGTPPPGEASSIAADIEAGSEGDSSCVPESPAAGEETLHRTALTSAEMHMQSALSMSEDVYASGREGAAV